jgi:PAS domain S-box-containing protein
LKDENGNILGTLSSGEDITKRKRAEEELRENKERLQALMDASPMGISWADMEGNIEYINKKFHELFGYTIEDMPTIAEWRRLAYPDIAYRETVPLLLTMLPKAGEQEREFPPIELTVTCKDGSIRYVEQMGSFTAHRILVIYKDITERKRAEEALRKSEDTQKQLAEENAIMAEIGRIVSSSLNIDEVYERFSEEVRKLIPSDRITINLINPRDNTATLAYTTGVDVPGRRAGDTIPLTGSVAAECVRARSSLLIQSDNIAEVTGRFPSLFHIFQAGAQSMIFVPLIFKDQVIGVFSLRATTQNVYTDKDLKLAESIGDQISGAVANAQLFAERKRVEEELRQSEEKYRTIIENIQDGYFEVDLAGNLTFVNDAECVSLGYSRDELIGMNNRQFTDKEYAKKLFQTFNKLYRTGEPVKGLDLEVIRKDGTKAFNELSISLLRDSGGKSIGFRGISRDITERKRVEEEKLFLQEQLRQSQKMEAIGRLAGGIAHDFNNLLTIIRSYGQLCLFELKESDPLWGNIQEIQNAAQRASDLTRQLLAFSRRQILEPKVLNMNDLLKNLDKMLRRIMGEDIELATLLADDLGRIKIDPGQFEQMILNLAVNARDAMTSGGKLTIETADVELDEEYTHTHIGVTPGRYIVLSMTDTGVGMVREVKDKIFEPFFTTKEKGTGLGLSTVYGIVKQSGGNIWIYSESGHGTTFKIYLPRVEEDLDIFPVKEETESISRGTETVLFVEDDQSVRELACHILEQQGYTILEAADGEEALQIVHEHAGEKIHLLFTDVVMPHMGGRELADQLKRLRPDIKVLFTSGYTDNAIVHHGVLESGIHILQKPFSPQSLSRKVREVLDR